MAASAGKPAKMQLTEWCQAHPSPNGSVPAFVTEGNGQIPTLFTTILTMPDGRTYESGKFRKKKESVHDAARKALVDIKKGEGSGWLSLSNQEKSATPEERLKCIKDRLTEIFVEEHNARSGSLRVHTAVAAARNAGIPFSALVAFDNKLSSACNAYDPGAAEADYSMAVALVKEVASRLCPAITLSEDGLGATRSTPYSQETQEFFSKVLQGYRNVWAGQVGATDLSRDSEGVVGSPDEPMVSQGEGGFQSGSNGSGEGDDGKGKERAIFEAVFIPCVDQWDVESIKVAVNVRNAEYYLDALAKELSCDNAGKLLISRTVGKSALNMRLYTALPAIPSVCRSAGQTGNDEKGGTDDKEKEDVMGCVPMGEGKEEGGDIKLAEGGGMLCKNVRASWLSGCNVYGDAILAAVGHAWEGPDVWAWRWTNLTIKDYHMVMMSRNPRGMYKLSRGAVVACELPQSFTSPLSWRGKLPKQMLLEYCQQRASLTKGQPCPAYKFYVIDEDGQAVPWKEGGEADDEEGAPRTEPTELPCTDDGKQEKKFTKQVQKEDERRKALEESTVTNIEQGRTMRLGIDVRSPGAENRGKPEEQLDKGLSPARTQKGQYICHVKLPTELGGFECRSPRAYKSQSAASHSAALGALHRIQRVLDLRALNPIVDDDFPPYGGSDPWGEGYYEPEEEEDCPSMTAMTAGPSTAPVLSLPPFVSRNGSSRRSLSLDMNAVNQSREREVDASKAMPSPAAEKEVRLPEKEVLVEGEGDIPPSAGSMVCVDYTMHELVCDLPLEREREDGWERVVYMSSTDKELLEENTNFEFELGSGAVIPPLDTCVSTMRKGEVCRFRMELSEYWVNENPSAVRKQQFMEKQNMLARLSSFGRQNSVGRVGSLGRQNALGLQIPLARQSSLGRGTPRRRGKKMVECRVKLVSITEPQEEKLEGALFSPPLSKQRSEFVLRLLSVVDAKSVIDLGCGAASLLEAVVGHSPVKHVAGIDISGKGLQRGAKVLKTKVTDSEASVCRASSLPESIVLYEGSINEPDARLRGFDLATCLEVVEHMDEEDLVKVGDSVLGGMMPRVLIVSTPNIEFNPLFFAERRTQRKGEGGGGVVRNSIQPPLSFESGGVSSSSNAVTLAANKESTGIGASQGGVVPAGSGNSCRKESSSGRADQTARCRVGGGNRVIGGLEEALRSSPTSHSTVDQRCTSASGSPSQQKNGVASKRGIAEDWSTVKLRNDDHRFEWTREEFRKWATPLAVKHGYTVWFDGVGVLNGGPPGDEGYATQIAIFVRGVEPSLVSGNVGVKKAVSGGVSNFEAMVGSWGGLSSVSGSMGPMRAEDLSDTEVVGSWGGAGSCSGSADCSSWDGTIAGPASWSGTGTAVCGSWGANVESGSWGTRNGCGSWNGDDRDPGSAGSEKKSHQLKVFWQWP